MPVTIGNILIANRGEIAMRIIRTLKKSDIGISCIYSETDKNTPWIRLCNNKRSLGPGNLSDTYLNIDKIIQAALEMKADAIHPGYGFLSENYRLAEACEQNKLVFIGPSPKILKIAGDKQKSHDIVKNLGIPVAEKITGSISELLVKEYPIEFPVFAKAVAGGGGRGIRRVRNYNELENTLRLVSHEALNSFGDDRVYLEKYIENPRHIEVQILGDQHGNRVHLFERECTVQRRHQKLIEEAPAANLSMGLRNSITDAALKIAAHLDYYSAGTIEFLVDQNENFLFLEINPRIQVEHGVTEMITGIDIVKEQINIANGNVLSLTQEQVTCRGHATEVRIYAEDPENNMVPLPGTIHFISFPESVNIRVDTGAESGTEIQPDYDALIAKLLAHGENRSESVRLLSKALSETVIAGIVHNLPLMETVFENPEYHTGSISTTWFENNYSSFSEQVSLIRQKKGHISPVIPVALFIINRKNDSDNVWKGYWRNTHQLRLYNGGQLAELYYEKQSNEITFYTGNDIFRVSSVYSDNYGTEYMLNGEFTRWYASPEKEGTIAISDGHFTYLIGRYSPVDAEFKMSGPDETTDDNMVIAPQPGIIVDVRVCEGQSVRRGDYLLTIESMKLENTIMASTGGVIMKIHIKTGDKVGKNAPLMHLQQDLTN